MRSTAIAALSALLTITAPAMAATELLTNGGFETGDYTGWTTATNVPDCSPDSCVGALTVVGTAVTPISAFPSVGPATGNWYSVTDQNAPGAYSLAQPFTVPSIAPKVVLSFDMFVNDQNGQGAIVDSAGLDPTALPNQHARVDLLTAAAGPWDTGGGVIQNYYLNVDAGPTPNSYTHYSFDITGQVTPGGIYQVRFAMVDTEHFMQQGVDNVSIAVVPEPQTYLMLLGGLAAVGVAVRRRR